MVSSRRTLKAKADSRVSKKKDSSNPPTLTGANNNGRSKTS